jgi:hypothetical protein
MQIDLKEIVCEDMKRFRIMSRVSVTADGVRIGNWIY